VCDQWRDEAFAETPPQCRANSIGEEPRGWAVSFPDVNLADVEHAVASTTGPTGGVTGDAVAACAVFATALVGTRRRRANRPEWM
jgi:hypothetical protein